MSGNSEAVMPGEPEQLSRRERKKEAMRDALESAALRLFVEKGYSETTVEDITDEVDVARRTFFRYFESKEAVVFARNEQTLAELELELRERPKDEPISTGVIAALRVLATRQEDEREKNLIRARISLNAPEVRARALTSQQAWVAALAYWIRERSGADDADMRPEVLASAVIGAVGAAFSHWVAGGGIEDPVDLMEQALAILDAGLGSDLVSGAQVPAVEDQD